MKLNWDTDWLISQVALEEMTLDAIRSRKYAEPEDYALAAESRERRSALLRELGEDK
jgi:hypothetical protein